MSRRSALQTKILLDLRRRQPKTVQELGDCVGAHRSSVSRSLRRLREQGLVKPGNLVLTEAGRREAKRAWVAAARRTVAAETTMLSIAKLMKNHPVTPMPALLSEPASWIRTTVALQETFGSVLSTPFADFAANMTLPLTRTVEMPDFTGFNKMLQQPPLWLEMQALGLASFQSAIGQQADALRALRIPTIMDWNREFMTFSESLTQLRTAPTSDLFSVLSDIARPDVLELGNCEIGRLRSVYGEPGVSAGPGEVVQAASAEFDEVVRRVLAELGGDKRSQRQVNAIVLVLVFGMITGSWENALWCILSLILAEHVSPRHGEALHRIFSHDTAR
jgi:DNA-binding transcriptional ArsR family regulator